MMETPSLIRPLAAVTAILAATLVAFGDTSTTDETDKRPRTMMLPQATAILPLEPLQWKHRVIVIRLPKTDAAAAKSDEPEVDAKTLAKLLETHKGAIVDRDIIWFVAGGEPETNATNTQAITAILDKLPDLPRPEPGAGLYAELIGKDGGTKGIQAGYLDLEKLFDQIDRMPMRRAEMRNHED